MQVILLERIEKLGFIGDLVEVKPGYARNFLLPQKKALRATKANLEVFEQQKAHLEANNLKLCEEAKKVAQKMTGLTLVMLRQAGDSGQLYGSVTMRDIAEGVSAEGFTINRQQVTLDQPIKILGLHKARIKLHPEVELVITINVAKSADEAAAQAAGEKTTEAAPKAALEEEGETPKSE
ncbi:MAG: 50S ribosomal protein L9 [Alphaproteobacteria bacterium]|nr:50S ribosomal protein L9 [Alphaproteobacteria bacterium]